MEAAREMLCDSQAEAICGRGHAKVSGLSLDCDLGSASKQSVSNLST